MLLLFDTLPDTIIKLDPAREVLGLPPPLLVVQVAERHEHVLSLLVLSLLVKDAEVMSGRRLLLSHALV